MSGKAVGGEALAAVGRVLCDPTRPMKERFRAAFTLRALGTLEAGAGASGCGGEALRLLAAGLPDRSALLAHELAYCLGQLRDARALPPLSAVLRDSARHPMVRHEAAEALGAIGEQSSRELLQEYASDPAVEVAETCQIALRRLAWLADGRTADERLSENPYRSVDPAPPSALTDVRALERVLLDEEQTLFDRYRAMFSLRNLATTESIDALGAGLRGAKSALFRHEVAFVFGQMSDVRSVRHLRAALEDAAESEMVRHEAAEALGAIATDECTQLLERYLDDESRVVRESCEVALDISEYENSPEFQYADTLLKVAA